MRHDTPSIRLKRIYDPPASEDGTRILVDRLWPRGVKREAAAIDHWLRELGPSHELRRWFAHEPAKWPDFRRRYRRELAEKTDLLDQLTELLAAGPATLVFAARDEARNNAVVIRDTLRNRLADPAQSHS